MRPTSCAGFQPSESDHARREGPQVTASLGSPSPGMMTPSPSGALGSYLLYLIVPSLHAHLLCLQPPLPGSPPCPHSSIQHEPGTHCFIASAWTPPGSVCGQGRRSVVSLVCLPGCSRSADGCSEESHVWVTGQLTHQCLSAGGKANARSPASNSPHKGSHTHPEWLYYPTYP